MTNREKYKENILDIVCSGVGFAFNRDTRKIVRCEDTSCHKCEFYTPDSVSCKSGVNHWCNSEYKEPEIDWSKVKVDTPILVSIDGKNWERRYFAGIMYDNSPLAWANGTTSWSVKCDNYVRSWKYAKLAESEE